MFLVIKFSDNSYQLFASYTRLKKMIGLAKGVSKPPLGKCLIIEGAYEIWSLEVDDKIM